MGGPERFDHYLERCLYDPNDGFYAAGRGSAGRRGADFLTSPEVGPLFGAVLARVLDSWWLELGRPDPYVVVDAGAGPGTLLRSVAVARPECLDALAPRAVDIAGDGPDLGELSGAVVLANELLDNLPFRVLERGSGGWLELYVENQTELLQPYKGPAPHFDLAEGVRAPLLDNARRWVEHVIGSGASRLLVFDYGLEETTAMAKRGGWLRTYRDHQRGDDPLHDPGWCDITTDVAFDQLPSPAALEQQGPFLRRWGIDQLVDEGRRIWVERAAAPDIEALRMRSRISEREALMDPDGLGSWWVALWQ